LTHSCKAACAGRPDFVFGLGKSSGRAGEPADPPLRRTDTHTMRSYAVSALHGFGAAEHSRHALVRKHGVQVCVFAQRESKPSHSHRHHILMLWPLSTGLRVSGSGRSRHGSRITDHGSRITDHGSRITDHGSRITDHGLRSITHQTSRSTSSYPGLCP
jgi:hypothetical protein